jgi:hypothetical protein
MRGQFARSDRKLARNSGFRGGARSVGSRARPAFLIVFSTRYKSQTTRKGGSCYPQACSPLCFECGQNLQELAFLQVGSRSDSLITATATRRLSPRPASGIWLPGSDTASFSRPPHHGHDPSPDGIGRAAPDGGQFSHLGRDRLGLHEAPRLLCLVR